MVEFTLTLHTSQAKDLAATELSLLSNLLVVVKPTATGGDSLLLVVVVAGLAAALAPAIPIKL